MRIAFDACVFINLFPLSKKVERFCAQNNKTLESFSSSDLEQVVKQELKLKQIYLDILKGLRSGGLEVVVLPTVYGECVDGPNKGKVEEFDAFLEKYHIKKETLCSRQNEACEVVKQKYIEGKGRAVPVDSNNSKHPLNDARILAEAFVTKTRLVTADTHFLRTMTISEKNQEIAQHFDLPEEVAKLLPMQITQFSKTKLFKSLNKEKSII